MLGDAHMKRTTRREMLRLCGGVGGAVGLGLPLVESAAAGEMPAAPKKLNVVAAGAHPDDPESGCGGTLALLSALGHHVVILYLTRGGGWKVLLDQYKTEANVIALRTRQAEEACKILGALPLFAEQKDSATEVNPARYQEFNTLLAAQDPDLLMTHWPVDTHRDHRATASLVLDFVLSYRKKVPLYFYEVMTGEQSQNFAPTDYVDITETEPKKRAALFCHESQRIEDVYGYHAQMQQFRGNECGCKAAEAFVHHASSPSSPLFLSQR